MKNTIIDKTYQLLLKKQISTASLTEVAKNIAVPAVTNFFLQRRIHALSHHFLLPLLNLHALILFDTISCSLIHKHVQLCMLRSDGYILPHTYISTISQLGWDQETTVTDCNIEQICSHLVSETYGNDLFPFFYKIVKQWRHHQCGII